MVAGLWGSMLDWTALWHTAWHNCQTLPASSALTTALPGCPKGTQLYIYTYWLKRILVKIWALHSVETGLDKSCRFWVKLMYMGKTFCCPYILIHMSTVKGKILLHLFFVLFLRGFVCWFLITIKKYLVSNKFP